MTRAPWSGAALRSRIVALVVLATSLLSVLGATPLASLAWAAVKGNSKKLIKMGWDEPDTRFMRAHIAQMERSPFDGCVFHLPHVKPEWNETGFTWEFWGHRAFTLSELKGPLADLQATSFRRFRSNFLRINATPGDIDWFDDFGPVLGNARLAARIAKQGGCAGLMFDPETYKAHIWEYRSQRDTARKSWDEYAAQARRRGREMMTAFQAEWPGLTVFMAFAYSLPWHDLAGGRRPLDDGYYGLLKPFLDGMLEAAEGSTTIVDGYELSYGYKDPELFAKAHRTMKRDVLSFVADSTKYRAHVSAGFGIWLDFGGEGWGWDENDMSKNYFTPDTLEFVLRRALALADRYVWVYDQRPRWWTAEGKSARLPAVYDAAIRRARK